tara:strand:+ start:412 stop:651 length:240 start_codon:yes stop_codon:yes gene_type:complete
LKISFSIEFIEYLNLLKKIILRSSIGIFIKKIKNLFKVPKKVIFLYKILDSIKGRKKNIILTMKSTVAISKNMIIPYQL